MHAALAETESRIQRDPIACHPRPQRLVAPTAQKIAHLTDHVHVAWVDLHRLRGALHVHQHDAAIAPGDLLERARQGQCAHVVDDGGSLVQCSAHHAGLAGVHRQRHCIVAQRLHQRQHALDLLIRADFGCPGPGRFAPDIQDVGAFGDQLPRVLQCAIELQEVPAVGKRVGRHVDNAHHQRALERKPEATAAPVGWTRHFPSHWGRIKPEGGAVVRLTRAGSRLERPRCPARRPARPARPRRPCAAGAAACRP